MATADWCQFGRQSALERVVVAVVAALATAGLAFGGLSLGRLLVHVAFVSGLIVICLVDLAIQRIPMSVLTTTAALSIAGILAVSYSDDVVGASTAAGATAIALAVVLTLARVASRGGMGRGDVRLGAMVGFVIGWHNWAASTGGTTTTTSLLAAWSAVVIAGTLAAISHMLVRAGSAGIVALPFAPALATGCFVVLLFT